MSLSVWQGGLLLHRPRRVGASGRLRDRLGRSKAQGSGGRVRNAGRCERCTGLSGGRLPPLAAMGGSMGEEQARHRCAVGSARVSSARASFLLRRFLRIRAVLKTAGLETQRPAVGRRHLALLRTCIASFTGARTEAGRRYITRGAHHACPGDGCVAGAQAWEAQGPRAAQLARRRPPPRMTRSLSCPACASPTLTNACRMPHANLDAPMTNKTTQGRGTSPNH